MSLIAGVIILPLLYFGHEDHRSYGYLAPIFWYRHTPERTTAVVATAYYDKEKNGDWLDVNFGHVVGATMCPSRSRRIRLLRADSPLEATK